MNLDQTLFPDDFTFKSSKLEKSKDTFSLKIKLKTQKKNDLGFLIHKLEILLYDKYGSPSFIDLKDLLKDTYEIIYTWKGSLPEEQVKEK